MNRLCETQAREVYDILVAEAGANEGVDRMSFELEFSGEHPNESWRFCGSIGFGGKFRYPAMTVDCYPEDETPNRLQAIERTNKKLRALQDEWKTRVSHAASNDGDARY